MKQLKLALSILFISITANSFGQKVKIKKDVITIDKQEYGIIEDDKSVRGSFYINDLKDHNLLYFKWVVSDGLNYYEIYKADDLDYILYEEKAVIGFRKYMVKKLYNAKALTTSGLNPDKLNDLAKKIGKEFSRIRNRRY